MSGVSVLPPDLLQAVADRRHGIAFVVGAGCSLEAPTDLLLSSAYSEAAFNQLKRNGVLRDGDCDPSDLSEVASAVFAKQGGQAPLVNLLPREEYQQAWPNLGHLLAVALMAEGAIACIATLNFDMALTNAMGRLRVTDITTVAAPADLSRFGGKAVVYLHRNAHEADVELWVLRKEVIEEQWQEGWESVVAERISSLPQLVFAGLGSRAAALTVSVGRVRERVGAHTRTYLVDPRADSAFADEVDLAHPGDHIQLTWGAFMRELAGRLTIELEAELTTACQQFGVVHGWDPATTTVGPVLSAIGQLNLVELGFTRGQWLGTGYGGYAPDDLGHRSYVPDDTNNRDYLADLVLGLGALVASDDCTVEVNDTGTISIDSPSNPKGTLTIHPVAGRGLEPWGTIDRVELVCSAAGPRSADVILVAGMWSQRPATPAMPVNISGDVPPDDISYAVTSLRIVDVDELRTDPSLRAELAR